MDNFWENDTLACSLRHLEIRLMDNINYSMENQEEWETVFSQICEKLTSADFTGCSIPPIAMNWLDPLTNAQCLTTLKIAGKTWILFSLIPA
jgi:hypothetical protein